MVEDFFKNKSCAFTTLLLLSYAYLHTKLTVIYMPTQLENLYNFKAPLPFGQRLLMPIIAHIVHSILPIKIDAIFFILEWLFISLVYIALFYLLSIEFNRKQAKLICWLFFLLLPLITVVNYRFTEQDVANFFYPYDTSALFFITASMYCCLKEKWYCFIALLFLATINRESSFLIVLLIPALHWYQRDKMYYPLLLSVMTFIVTRLVILYALNNHPGHIMEWRYTFYNQTHFENNLNWLFPKENFLLFLFTLAGLPALWFTFFDYIPPPYRPLRYVVLFYFLGLLQVGIFKESRIFTELSTMLYFPVCVAIRRWLRDLDPYQPLYNYAWLYYCNRYAILILLTIIVVFARPINQLIGYVFPY